MGSRDLKKSQTREVIRDTAHRLFEERGFENVAVAEIARRAKVSEKTVFNYFAKKEDLVFGANSFESKLIAAIAARPPGETIIAAARRFILEPRWLPSSQYTERLAGITRVIMESPTLQARERRMSAHHTTSLARLIADETHADPEDVEPFVAANAILGVDRGLLGYLRRQALSGTSDSLAQDYLNQASRALDRLERGLAQYAPKPGHE